MFELEKDAELDNKSRNNSSQSTEANQKIYESLDWTPIGGGTSNVTTCRLKQVSPTRIESTGSSGMKLFNMMFWVIGVGCLINYAFTNSSENSWLSLIIGISFSTIAIFFQGKPFIIDKKIGWYWTGSSKFKKLIQIQNASDKGRISRIIAIQMLEEYIPDVDDDYFCYELNFICENNLRQNVIRHGGKYDLMGDAKMMAKFLEIPYFERVS